MTNTYDLVVIGGGAAGLTAAFFGKEVGASVALIERKRIGGDCTWTGCVPSKSLLASARIAHQSQVAATFGLMPSELRTDLRAVMERLHRIVAETYAEESPDALREAGIDVILGEARFEDPRTIIVASSPEEIPKQVTSDWAAAMESVTHDRGRRGTEQLTHSLGDRGPSKTETMTRLRARKFVLATGARPWVPPITGMNKVPFATSETIWQLQRLPDHLIVVGGGPIGCEMSQAFRRLGAKVTLLEAGDRLLMRGEPEAAELMRKVLQSEGVDVRLGHPMERVALEPDHTVAKARIRVTAGGKALVGDTLLVAVGRKPNVEALNLEAAGVIYTEKGIQVDDKLRTSQKHIYAAGDCLGTYQFTHYADFQGRTATRNALLPGAWKGQLDSVPWTVFTEPEVAQAGLTEAQARNYYGDSIATMVVPIDKADRARTESDTRGFIKVVHKDGKPLGVTIVSARAGESIQEWIYVLNGQLRVRDLATTIHVYPTYGQANVWAAGLLLEQQLRSGRLGRLVDLGSRLALQWMRWRQRR